MTPGTVATQAAQRATATVPIVMTTGDPVGSGFVKSLARPGGNITGLSLQLTAEFSAKRLDLLKEAVPGARRVATSGIRGTQLLTGTFMEYALPRADDMPDLVRSHRDAAPPPPSTRWGVKGVGEGSACVAPPAIVKAVVDALSPFGVRHVDMPLTAEKIWRAIPRE